MKRIISTVMFLLSLGSSALAGQFDDIKNCMVIIDTDSGRRSGVLMKFEGSSYVLTSQDAFSGSLVSMKTLSGDILQPLMFEVPEEPVGLLRIKVDYMLEKDISPEDRNGDAEVYRTDVKMGIISEQAVNIGDGNILRFPDENGARVPYFDDVVGSPVFSMDGKMIGIAGINGYSLQNCGWTWGTDQTRGLSERRNELQSIGQVRKWKKVDQVQLFKQGAMIDDAENFLFPFSVVADTWYSNSYGTVAVKPEQPDKMKAWIDTQNTMVKTIPISRIRIQNVNEKVGATMRNVVAGQLREQNKAIGKRLCDFLPYYSKSLSSPNIKWESSYFRKKSEDISAIYRNLYDGLKKEAENCGKANPPL